MRELVKNQKGISVFPVVILVAVFLFLSFGPFSTTAARLLKPVVEHANRIVYSVFSWLS
jgi:hypothetical protein